MQNSKNKRKQDTSTLIEHPDMDALPMKVLHVEATEAEVDGDAVAADRVTLTLTVPSGLTPALLAARNGHDLFVKVLVDQGVSA